MHRSYELCICGIKVDPYITLLFSEPVVQVINFNIGTLDLGKSTGSVAGTAGWVCFI